MAAWRPGRRLGERGGRLGSDEIPQHLGRQLGDVRTLTTRLRPRDRAAGEALAPQSPANRTRAHAEERGEGLAHVRAADRRPLPPS